jgi:phosphoglucan, water dikinase
MPCMRYFAFSTPWLDLKAGIVALHNGDSCLQELLTPEVSFVLHTADPLSGDNGAPDPGSLYAELAPGLGETLASGTAGSAWRMSINKSTQAVQMHAFANFSQAYLPTSKSVAMGPGQSLYSKAKDAKAVAGKIAYRTVDYSKQPLSNEKEQRTALGWKLTLVGQALEDAFSCAQDVEGGIVNGRVYVVQSRPQP